MSQTDPIQNGTADNDGDAHPASGQPPAGGRRGATRTRVVPAIVWSVVAILAVAASWFIIDTFGNPVQAELHSWDPPEDGVMPVTVEVDRPPGTELTCELVAIDNRYVVVGQLTLDIPASPDRRERIDAAIPLRGDGIAPNLQGCSATG